RRALEEDVREAVVQKQQGRLRSSSALLTSLGLLTEAELHSVQMARVPEPNTRQARRMPTSSRSEPPPVQLATITRSEFAEFADATGREPARCHLLLSPLRLINPRDWRDFGKPADPVVCISYDDAQAYARWRSRRDGASFRLPSGPAEAIPAASGIGVWTLACAEAALPGMGDEACPRRVAAGTGEGTRPVAPDRGYDQVGLLLIREG